MINFSGTESNEKVRRNKNFRESKVDSDGWVIHCDVHACLSLVNSLPSWFIFTVDSCAIPFWKKKSSKNTKS